MSARTKNSEFEKWLADWMARIRETGNVLASIPADNANAENNPETSRHIEASGKPKAA
jgi:hypothetical protein